MEDIISAMSPGGEADAIVVGAGPGGSATAAHLARLGVHTILLEKSKFPREKVCGDGLTPRSVKALINLGIDTSEESGWIHNKGLRVYTGNASTYFELPWPELADFPNYGMTRSREEFDQILARHAQDMGATLITEAPVQAPIINSATGRIEGVTLKDGRQFRAPVVVAADGNSSRLAIAMGLPRRDDRPMGVAVRAYYRAAHTTDDWMESWLEMWDGEPAKSDLLPGYVWVFGLGNSVTNVGLGMLNSSPHFGKIDYRQLLKKWAQSMPEEWGYCEENRLGEIRGAALPMGFNRDRLYQSGMLLVGDAAGLVSPFNGEGISYAMESGQMAAEAIAQARSLGFGSRASEKTLAGYDSRVRAAFGGYFRLGQVFTKLIGNPTIMHLCVKYGLPRRRLMVLVNKLLAHLTDSTNGNIDDKIINALIKIAPSM